MIFKLHYWLNSAGTCAIGILLGAFIETYTDASAVEIGALFMMMPFLGLLTRPLICSFADRQQAHREYIIWCSFISAVSYCPFVIIPFLGESFYGQHPRLSWYLLLTTKVFGDIAFGACQSIGDTLAMNYSRRIGTEFAIYRIWGTISWIAFGIIIGQVNEVWFLPKYVPAFMVLVLCSLVDSCIFWLWPNEYFTMLTEEEMEREAHERRLRCPEEAASAGNYSLTKSLMPRDVVWAHAKSKLRGLFRSCLCLPVESQTESSGEPKAYLPSTLAVEEFVNGSKANTLQAELKQAPGSGAQEDKPIDKSTQIRTLLVLIRRDIRIVGYCTLFVLGGLHSMTTNFLFINLSEICNVLNLCNYSTIGGWIQASLASTEMIAFIYMRHLQRMFGRVNLAGIGLILLTVKFAFYAFVWYDVSPYWAILIEVFHGAVFAILLTQQVETAHMFANEVEYILPELKEKNIIKNQSEVQKIKLSLSATMQAVMINAENGIGRGFGALIYGIIIQKYSYRTLWVILTYVFGIATTITFLVNFVCYLFKIKVGPNKSNKTPVGIVEKTALETKNQITLKLSNNNLFESSTETTKTNLNV